MPTYKDTVMIYDPAVRTDRAVQVIIDAPDGVSVLNVQELAEAAWRSVNKTVTIKGVTVKVRKFER